MNRARGTGRSESRVSKKQFTGTADGTSVRPRLDIDAVMLIREPFLFLGAGERAVRHALDTKDCDELTVAAAHFFVCSARAARFLSRALHIELPDGL